MKKIEPNNCPLCKSKMIITGDDILRYDIHCSEKSCILHSGIYASGITEEEIVNAWNNSFKFLEK